VPTVVVKPIRRNADLAAKVELVAVASRSADKASAFAKEWGIPRSFGSYAELLADPDIDVVYNSLPNALHCEWTVRALLAGKHVLCGKPLASNALEAVVMQRAAEDTGKVCLEAFHAICHPVCKRVRELVVEGKVGTVERVTVNYPVELSQYDQKIRSKMHKPTPLAEDYRLNSEMGGGVTMDLGCYCVAMVKAVTGEDPHVVSASAQRWQGDPEVDVAMTCEMSLPSGATANFNCSFVAGKYAQPVTMCVAGSGGKLHVEGFFSAHKANKITLEQWDDVGVSTSESVDDPGNKNTQDSFYYQLMAFIDEVSCQEKRGSKGMPWEYTKNKINTPAEGVKTMAVLEDVYRAAGMKPRWTTNPPPAPYNAIGMSKL
jgi:predicted dehydrogenase